MIDAEVRGPLANMDVPNPGDILLRVKSASHPSCEDLEFHVQSSFSVKRIKEEIKRLSAQHPEIKEQRLIFSGHLLDDNQVLKDVLTGNCGSQISSQQPVTFHLACTSKYMFNPTPTPAKSTSQKPQPDLPGGNGDIPQQPFNNQPFSTPDFGIPPEGNVPQDMFSLHQAYVEQMTVYMNQWYLHQSMMSGMFTQMPPGNYYYPQQPQPAAAPAPPRNDAPLRAQENINLAAARALDDEDNQRDLLDWMYSLSRAVLIFSVVYFYSSFSRFLLVVVFTGLVMILQRRNGNANQNQNAEGVNANPNAPRPAAGAGAGGADQANGANDNAGENPAAGAVGDENAAGVGENGETANPNQVPPPPERGIKEIAWTFLTTFFTSLIPENYQNN